MKQTNSWSEITTLSVSEFKILNIRPRAIGKINGDKKKHYSSCTIFMKKVYFSSVSFGVNIVTYVPHLPRIFYLLNVKTELPNNCTTSLVL